MVLPSASGNIGKRVLSLNRISRSDAGVIARLRPSIAAEAIDDAPASQARNDVAGQHGFAIVERQPVPQDQPPGQSVIFNLVPSQHLWMNVEVVVLPIERVEYHEGMESRDIGDADQWIEPG